MFRIARLIDRIISSNPRIILVSSSNLLPEPYCTILMIFIVPESRVIGDIIGMLIGVLSAWNCMHVKHRINLFLGAIRIIREIIRSVGLHSY